MTLLEVRNLTYGYRRGDSFVRVVDDVSFDVAEGETVGLIGESGSGKSSVLYAILRLLKPNAAIESGTAHFEGRDLLALSRDDLDAVRWNRLSMVFQGAMNALNPVIRIDSLLMEAYLRHAPGATRKQARERALEVLGLVQIPDRVMHSYAHELSGGMRQRVIIALALICGPSLLFADEPTTALDVVLQDEIMAELEDVHSRMGFGMLLVSHDLALVSETSDRIMVMYAGQIIETGTSQEIIERPLHPYTIGLLRSYPSRDRPVDDLVSIPGTPPDPAKMPTGCRFADRCPLAEPECSSELLVPLERTSADNRLVRCRRVDAAEASRSELFLKD